MQTASLMIEKVIEFATRRALVRVRYLLGAVGSTGKLSEY
jgi:hypothetical protein